MADTVAMDRATPFPGERPRHVAAGPMVRRRALVTIARGSDEERRPEALIYTGPAHTAPKAPGRPWPREGVGGTS